jgi:hypothetical protein
VTLPHLYVSVRLHGAVADQRLCTVRDEVWLGSAPGAEVAFPGPALRVRRLGERLQVQGHWLKAGQPVCMVRGPLEVHLEAVTPSPRSEPSEWVWPDLRVMLASAAIVLFGAWWEAVGAFLERHPGAVASLASGVEDVAPAGLLTGPDGETDPADDDALPCYPCDVSPLGLRPAVEYRIEP